jgi:hypothetical protein
MADHIDVVTRNSLLVFTYGSGEDHCGQKEQRKSCSWKYLFEANLSHWILPLTEAQ